MPGPATAASFPFHELGLGLPRGTHNYFYGYSPKGRSHSLKRGVRRVQVSYKNSWMQLTGADGGVHEWILTKAPHYIHWHTATLRTSGYYVEFCG